AARDTLSYELTIPRSWAISGSTSSVNDSEPSAEKVSVPVENHSAARITLVLLAVCGAVVAFVFRRARVRSHPDSEESPLHQCKICHRTEKSDPLLEFRVGADGSDYCREHLPPRLRK